MKKVQKVERKSIHQQKKISKQSGNRRTFKSNLKTEKESFESRSNIVVHGMDELFMTKIDDTH